MFRIASCFLIILLSAAGGYLYTFRYTKRIRILREARDKFSTMEREIVFSMKTLPDICHGLSQESGELSRVMEYVLFNTFEENKPFAKAWHEGVYKVFENSFLKKEDKENLAGLTKGLGEGDIIQQKKCFEHTFFEIDKMLKQAEEDKKRLSKMYMSLFLAGGLGISIMLI